MILFVFQVLSLFPLRLLQFIGRIGGMLIYALPGRYHDRLKANARQAGYADSSFAWKAAAQTGAMIMELPKIWFQPEKCLRLIQDEHQEILITAKQHKQPILFLTPHLGSFEITARYGATFQPLTVMFRPPRQAFLVPVIEATRARSGINAVPANMSGVRAFLKALRNGESVGMLPDQVPREGDGVWAPFFGKPAWSVTLPGKLASLTNPLIIIAACERLPKGKGWKMHYIQVQDPLPEDPAAQAALFNRLMEEMIRKFPQQYLWGYHRYKRPSTAPEPPAQTPVNSAQKDRGCSNHD